MTAILEDDRLFPNWEAKCRAVYIIANIGAVGTHSFSLQENNKLSSLMFVRDFHFSLNIFLKYSSYFKSDIYCFMGTSFKILNRIGLATSLSRGKYRRRKKSERDL